ncbi:ABC transporter permease [Deltaproteobacteria bacterium OttesenSCG-928-K17]|nr:ABC transporter permease [Deltaproteobacteria bacterium OttesenSCG-928-K17]
MTFKTWKPLAAYLVRNLIRLILVLAAVSALSFALVAFSPVDPVRQYAGEVGAANMSDETLAKFRSYFGSDTPPVQRYLNWASGALRGDMGQSLIYRQPVTEVIGAKFMNSMVLMAAAWLCSGVIAFILGISAGIFRDSLLDRIIKGYALILASTPTFWLALIMLMVFSVWLNWFPIGLSAPLGSLAAEVTVFDKLRHLILPALTLSVTGVASITLHTREKMIDVMAEDYILNARARGQSLWHIVRHHGLRNVMIPAITLQFASISEIFGGSVLVEQVFSYPGLGQAAVLAGLGGDAPLLLGIAVISAAIVFGGNLIANLLYGLIDPKIRRGGGHA